MLERLHRLRKMSNAEVAHRLRERWRKETDRLRFYYRRKEDDAGFDRLTEPHHASLKEYLCKQGSSRFYPPVQDGEGTLRFIAEQFPEWFDHAVHEAGRLSEHRLNILGHSDVALDGDIDWHRDPVTGFQWGRQYCA